MAMATKPATPAHYENVYAKIGILERRRLHLMRKLEKPEYASSHSANFDRDEIGALNAAIAALEEHG